MATASINWGDATKYDENYEELASLLDSAPPYQPPNYNDTSPIVPTSHVRYPTDEKTLETLSPEQRYALRLIQEGKNTVIIGGAGVGKSYVFQLATKCFFKKDIAIAASTGCAAMLVGGGTAHSLFGIVNGDADPEDIYRKTRKNKIVSQHLNSLRVIFIDEISMISAQLFEKMEYVVRKIRNIDLPFGGVQMVMCGDLAQMPPVTPKKKERQRYIFESEKWFQWFPEQHHVILTQVFRQKEKELCDALEDIRDAKYTNKVKELVEKVKRKLNEDDGIKPTYLTPKRDDVTEKNLEELQRLPGHTYSLTAEDKFSTPGVTVDALNKACQAPAILELKVGAQVMLLKNLDVKMGLSNGSRGVVVRIETNLHKEVEAVHVRFVSGLIFPCVKVPFEMKTASGFILATRFQFPLLLAAAMTISKAQGLTLDRVVVDLKNCFGDGTVYVAMSRAETIEGLELRNFNPCYMKQSLIVKNFYEKIRKANAPQEESTEPPKKKQKA
jgi:ATP-dependent DNA helicase PIF1